MGWRVCVVDGVGCGPAPCVDVVAGVGVDVYLWSFVWVLMRQMHWGVVLAALYGVMRGCSRWCQCVWGRGHGWGRGGVLAGVGVGGIVVLGAYVAWHAVAGRVTAWAPRMASGGCGYVGVGIWGLVTGTDVAGLAGRVRRYRCCRMWWLGLRCARGCWGMGWLAVVWHMPLRAAWGPCPSKHR